MKEKLAEVVLTARLPLLGAEAVEVGRPLEILRHAVAVVVVQPEIMQRDRIALECRVAIPADRLGPVLLHAKAVGVNGAEAHLGACDIVLGSAPKPDQCLGVVLAHAFAFGVALGELELNLAVPFFRLGGQIGQVTGADERR